MKYIVVTVAFDRGATDKISSYPDHRDAALPVRNDRYRPRDSETMLVKQNTFTRLSHVSLLLFSQTKLLKK
jgi:hypothetical protein